MSDQIPNSLPVEPTPVETSTETPVETVPTPEVTPAPEVVSTPVNKMSLLDVHLNTIIDLFKDTEDEIEQHIAAKIKEVKEYIENYIEVNS